MSYQELFIKKCMEAVKKERFAFQDIPEELKTSEICMEAVKKDGMNLGYVPKELRTPEMYMEAIKSDGKALQYVPKELRTPEMYIEAVKSNGLALPYVPEELRTPEMYMEAVKSDGKALQYVPEELLTPEMCMEAVKNNGLAIWYVPKKFKTSEMCMEAVKNDKLALQYVLTELKTPEMCMETVKNIGLALKYVPEKLRTPKMCIEAVKSDGLALQYVPEELLTPEMSMEAVKNIGLALQYVPKELKTSEMCMKAVKSHGGALQYVPKELKTPEICMEAVKIVGTAMSYVPEELRTPEMYMEAVKNDGAVLRFVPEALKTQEMCMEAFKTSSTALQYVPLGMRSLEIYIESLSRLSLRDDIKDILETCKKADKFNELCHFVPNVNVLEKYPKDQIEKFNKKIWFNMARNELYNVNIDTKKSLVEVALSFGVFDKDAKQLERIGLIQKMATYIPKDEALVVSELDEFTKENFEVIGKETTYHINKEKLLSDSNIINIFGSKEQAKVEIGKLAENLSLEDMEKALNIDATDENTSNNYKKVMTYIYKLGYDKAEQDKGYIIKLKTDIQQEKIKDKKKGQELEDKIRQFYYSHNSKQIMTPEKLHRIFDGMDMKYKPGFYEFFKDNYEQILADTEKQSEISKIQNQWDKIVEANLGQKVNFEKCEAYIYSHVYENVGEDELEIAKLASNCGYSQEQFEQVQEIFNEQKKRTQSSIPQIEKKMKKQGIHIKYYD